MHPDEQELKEIEKLLTDGWEDTEADQSLVKKNHKLTNGWGGGVRGISTPLRRGG